MLKEFPELASCADNSKVLEVGCGNGSTALPILWYFLDDPVDVRCFSCPCYFSSLLNLYYFYAVDERASFYMPVIVVMRLLRGLKRLLLLLHLYLLCIAFTHSFVIFQQLDFPHGWPATPAQKAPLTGIFQDL